MLQRTVGALVLLAVAANYTASQAQTSQKTSETVVSHTKMRRRLVLREKPDQNCFRNADWLDANIKNCRKSDDEDCIQKDCNLSVQLALTDATLRSIPCSLARQLFDDIAHQVGLGGPNVSTYQVWYTSNGEIQTLVHYYRAPVTSPDHAQDLVLGHGRKGSVTCSIGERVRCCT